MVERKVYKTKLCVLYQRGRCNRQTCSFAHGNTELRRFSDSTAAGERRDFRGRDLREKLDRRRSPVGRYSYDRDARERHASRDPMVSDRDARERHASQDPMVSDRDARLIHASHDPVVRYSSDRDRDARERHASRDPVASDREARERHASRDPMVPDRDARERHASRDPMVPDRDARERHASRRTPTESVGRRSDRKRRMKHHSDGQSDISRSLNMSDGTGDHVKEKKHLSSNSKDVLQLKQLQSEINMLDDQKRELEIYLEETTCEAEELASKVQDLEMELFKEKEECKRTTSKVKLFIEAYNNHSRVEGELKRSEAQLQKLANRLSSDFVRTSASEEDSAINISDGGLAGNHFSSLDEQQKNTSPTKKRPRIHREADETTNQASTKGKGDASQRIAYPTQLNNEKKEKAEFDRENGHRTVVGEEMSKKGINFSSDMAFTNKPKASDIGIVLPSTSMAAHAADEDVEVVETEVEVTGNTTRRAGKGTPSGIREYPFLPPPPPLPPGGYLQHKCDNADGLEDEMLEVDIV
ncbi:zinc finger CCCH domain-containing protein 13 isoform X2 [Lycium barbarum]|uniref:zinc finger CCCH domain-containing protein 13 isoform X2 n=1 Tax=Lycium barbarum TaxID=112863 RepID=UPI00293E9902|nr:zinc finger CCCH domain-containing protein 13 isoform X2 [Lycium barbarum]